MLGGIAARIYNKSAVVLSISGLGHLFTEKNLKIVDEEAKINPDMSIAKMKSEFGKTLKTKKISRVLLNKFVERVA